MNNIIPTEETHPLTWRLRNDRETVWIEEYCKKNGYFSLKKALKTMCPEDVVHLIKESGLKGRGGAGFSTGLKWSLMSKDNSSKIRYLLCNADEMEPGTYKDRFLMENIPHQLIEGMLLSAFALNVSRGYIFLRGEYIKAEYILKKSIQEAINFGFIGSNILNSGFNFELFLHTGAGRYICGEETALINSLEGRRANPRAKPPFPAVFGLWGKPTCVNNVETLSNVPSIVLHGVNWYKKLSKSTDTTGTKLMGFSGKVNNPGVWELPFGTTAREILEDYARGMKSGLFLKSWQPGGAGTDFLIEKHLDLPMDFTSIAKAGSRLGTAIAMAVDNKTNMISLVCNIEKFFSRESCGLCTPCREGLPWIVKILESLEKKEGHKNDVKNLERLCLDLSPGKTFCAHAPGAVEPLQSAIKYFRLEFEAGISIKKLKKCSNILGIQSNEFTSKV
ncbi:NADH-quinone oxidoreductase subunit NuoF [Buchnera aphidicola]|jgi:NADH-quinone oxidoreductase subunit F|uniref:NADH-quinone oxidoreductase subunit F n=1 Tax=Buchnera aphidicola subsp. Schizaphis graminum (strain Sg) TaxID=198804 RepID=NUOF_BUCAP|nr:NADH-quinone oxidoreductase subunit NuoF [Buchnera aphidicola]Q8K9Y3.1 RecName: Full=NADH-quinone oxidoreductase subunit F; AltName: Full=NADH dehydrogenase I subunit F; AltName: Full=NDH-1 subunit F [Buchnera aphidicola str. Sg (Schizaphis graminum)]AAM67719.1 NADH dehydrogenase I chain F [Buchnera aphidicola str. Sg (Schizaphis graminum)]AWI49785.1 NADH-quinone oxidoreductase subunit NuoF [Buchnera aphidicola (Schizaphis graminum)]